MAGIVATAETDIIASPARVWSALTDPAQIKRYMFGSEVETDWKPGGTIVWKGEYQGRAYQDKGQVVEVEPERRLVVTHFSPLSGQDDVPENYHTLAYVLEPRGEGRPADKIFPITFIAAGLTFFLITVTGKPGGRTAVISAAIAAMAAPMVFELPFDLIVMARTYPPIPRIRRRRVTVPVTLGRCLGCR